MKGPAGKFADEMRLTAAEADERETLFVEARDLGDPANVPVDYQRLLRNRERIQRWLNRFPHDPTTTGFVGGITASLEEADLVADVLSDP